MIVCHRTLDIAANRVAIALGQTARCALRPLISAPRQASRRGMQEAIAGSVRAALFELMQ